ncbi:hypothetical protein NPIL_332741 [Nephila pilipes]|uniref:DUF5641 domain-containing protein n=1 Tax=Nephila pilipes TaxID=299642 RepID=A0A8X6PW71_NEPPI|nr:hypothetical protein NPIL_332741 [Nephila pilipes]
MESNFYNFVGSLCKISWTVATNDITSSSSQTLVVGDIVLLESDGKKRNYWPLARVLELILGNDGQNRVFCPLEKDDPKQAKKDLPLLPPKKQTHYIEDKEKIQPGQAGYSKMQFRIKLAAEYIENQTYSEDEHRLITIFIQG